VQFAMMIDAKAIVCGPRASSQNTTNNNNGTNKAVKELHSERTKQTAL